MANNSFTETFQDGTSLTQTQLETALQSLKLDLAQTTQMTTGSTSGQALISNGSAVAASFQTIPDPKGPSSIRNYGLKATAAAGVLVVSLKTNAGTSPTGSDAVDFTYSTNGTTSATYSAVQVTAATTLSVSASATLGLNNTSSIRVYVYGYYNTSTSSVKLAVSTRADFDSGNSVSMTAMSASSDLTNLYASASLTAMPRLLGYILTSRNASGSWQTPTNVNIVNNQLDSFDIGRRLTFSSSTSRIGQIGLSSSSGNFTSSSASPVTVTNLKVVYACTGKPLVIALVPDGGANQSVLGGARLTSGTAVNVDFFISVDSSNISRHGISIVAPSASSGIQSLTPVGTVFMITPVSAGSHTIEVVAQQTSGGTQIICQYARLMVYELN